MAILRGMPRRGVRAAKRKVNATIREILQMIQKKQDERVRKVARRKITEENNNPGLIPPDYFIAR
jgi:hypothetical protein